MYITSENKEKLPYRPALERWSLYKNLWIRHWTGFLKEYPGRFQCIYGPLSNEKKKQVGKLIRCGKFKNGFQRQTCTDCGTVLVVPFTCKSRLCLSCARKRLFGWSLNLSRVMDTDLRHTHVTFTIPGQLSRLLFERRYAPEQMISLAAGVYKNFLKSSAQLKGKEYKPGILATLHKAGNGLNMNPHVHLIGTQDIIDTNTGEIITIDFLPYSKIRHLWQSAFLPHLVNLGIITDEEKSVFHDRYKKGFHVFFQPIKGDSNEVLFRTAEYIATGFFHNSQIKSVDHAKRTITFTYRKFMERGTRKKHYATRTMDIYSFMARMLYFLPGTNRKMIRYYGIYASNVEKKLDEIELNTWAKAIEHSFEKNPEICPECSAYMITDVVYSVQADKEIKELMKSHTIEKGYFVPLEKSRPP